MEAIDGIGKSNPFFACQGAPMLVSMMLLPLRMELNLPFSPNRQLVKRAGPGTWKAICI